MVNAPHDLLIPDSIAKYAIYGGNEEIISIVEQKGYVFNNMLKKAVKSHRHNLINWIIDNYSQPEQIPLTYPILNSNTLAFVYFYFISKDKVSINFVYESSTVTQMAAFKENIDLLLYLLSIGGENGCTENSFEPPLMKAAENNNLYLVNLLLEKGAKVDEKSSDDYTSLFSIAELGYIDVARALIDNGADINYRRISSEDKLSVYDRAILYNQQAFAKFISSHPKFNPLS